MRLWHGASVVLLGAAGAAGCTLLVSLDGLDGPAAAEAGAEASAEDAGTACALGATTPNLVLYYQFEETTGTRVRDCSSTGADGVLEGDAAAVSVIGRSGRAFSFDGANTCVRVGTQAALSFTGAFTFAAWVSVKAFAATPRVSAFAGKTTNTTTEGWRIGADLGSVLTFRLGEPSGAAFEIASTTQPTNTWRHYAAVFTPSTSGAIFVDGELDQEKSSVLVALTPSAAELRVGCLPGGNFFSGTLDELRLYDRALSATEIRQLAR